MATETARPRGTTTASTEQTQRRSTWGVDFARFVHSALGAGVDVLFPPSCHFCGINLDTHADILLCNDCISAMAFADRKMCRRCASPLPACVSSDHDCPRCKDQVFRFHRVSAVGVYEGDLRDAIIKMKQAQHEPLTIAMGQLLAQYLVPLIRETSPDVIVPVPSHWLRRLRRGTSPAGMLAETLSRQLHIPADEGLLVLCRATKKQGTLSPAERFKNVRGAFVVPPNYDLGGVSVLLVDDVMTTGATVNEAARMLRRAGAASVAVGVVARGIGAH